VPHEKKGNQIQGGVFELPIAPFSTGVMRGRFNPGDGQLYACGLSAWGSAQPELGGFYRIRYNGEKTIVPLSINVLANGIRIRFSHELNKNNVENIKSYQVQTWDLKRSRKYGSDHHNTKTLNVKNAILSKDKKEVFLSIIDLKTTNVMEITFQFLDDNGKIVKGLIQNTINQIGK